MEWEEEIEEKRREEGKMRGKKEEEKKRKKERKGKIKIEKVRNRVTRTNKENMQINEIK